MEDPTTPAGAAGLLEAAPAATLDAAPAASLDGAPMAPAPAGLTKEQAPLPG